EALAKYANKLKRAQAGTHPDPSSTVGKTTPLITNDLQRRQKLLALHFLFFHSIHSFSRRVGGRATPAARHALCASPITWLRNRKCLPWNTASTSCRLSRPRTISDHSQLAPFCSRRCSNPRLSNRARKLQKTCPRMVSSSL